MRLSTIIRFLFIFSIIDSFAFDIPITREVLSHIKNYSEITEENGEFKITLNQSVNSSDAIGKELLDSLRLYVFINNETGEFLKNVTDSIAKYDDYNSRLIKRGEYNGQILSEFIDLKSTIVSPGMLEKIKGIIINDYQDNDKVKYRGLYLMDDNPEWIKLIGAQDTGKKVPVVLNNCLNIVSAMADELFYRIILKIAPSGKVEIPGFYLSNTPIYEQLLNNGSFQRRKDIQSNIQHLNDWIIAFYYSHGYSEKLLYWPLE